MRPRTWTKPPSLAPLYRGHGRSGSPDPTSGEERISNFLLWQIAYTELYLSPVYWPDFREPQLMEALADYQRRERRFGKISEQLVKEA